MVWREYGRPLLIGFFTGSLIGFVQPYTMGVEQPNPLSHFILVGEMGLAFAILALILQRYYRARIRMYRKLTEGKAEGD